MNDLPKVIIDTDAGHDDVLAMMLLIKSNLVNVLAVTTVAGNSVIENTTRNAAFILDLLGRKDIPLYSGYANPLERKLVTAVVHGESGLDGVDKSKTNFKLTQDADKQLIRLIKENPYEVTILTIGPLSNIARALIKEPALASLIKRIVIMGGTVNAHGNKNRVAEFNFFVDPEAADIVFKTKVDKVMIPLDVCNNIPMFKEDFDDLKDHYLYNPLMGMLEKYIEGIYKDEGTRGALMYDVIAAYYIIKPSEFKVEPMDILIETKGEHTFGMTVVEKRETKKKEFNVNVVTDVNRNAFVTDFINILKK